METETTTQKQKGIAWAWLAWRGPVSYTHLVYFRQQFLNGLGAYVGLELILIALAHVAVFLLAQKLLFLQRRHACLLYTSRCV